METLLVTGGAGFIGCNFVRYALAHTDYRVVVLDKLTYAGSLLNLEEVAGNPRYAFERGDIAVLSQVEAIFRKHEPDYVVNFAAETHVDRSIDGPAPFVETNVVGTFILLDSALKYCQTLNAKRKSRFHLLHVSTDEVYGSLGKTGLFTETTPYAPNSPYSASKAAADHFVRAYAETYGLPALITNCSNNYGPYQFPEKLIPLMILNTVEAKPLPIYGDGGNVRDWLHVEDHCAGILLALEKGKAGEKYNIGGGNECSNLEVVDLLCAILEKIQPAAKNPAMQKRGLRAYKDLKTFVPDRPGHDRRYAIDAAKIRKELRWKPAYNFKTGLEQTVRWYLEHLDWCKKVQADNYGRERLGTGKAAVQTASKRRVG